MSTLNITGITTVALLILTGIAVTQGLLTDAWGQMIAGVVVGGGGGVTVGYKLGQKEVAQ